MPRSLRLGVHQPEPDVRVVAREVEQDASDAVVRQPPKRPLQNLPRRLRLVHAGFRQPAQHDGADYLRDAEEEVGSHLAGEARHVVLERPVEQVREGRGGEREQPERRGDHRERLAGVRLLLARRENHEENRQRRPKRYEIPHVGARPENPAI